MFGQCQQLIIVEQFLRSRGEDWILPCCGTWGLLVYISACLPLLWARPSEYRANFTDFLCPRTGVFGCSLCRTAEPWFVFSSKPATAAAAAIRWLVGTGTGERYCRHCNGSNGSGGSSRIEAVLDKYGWYQHTISIVDAVTADSTRQS